MDDAISGRKGAKGKVPGKEHRESLGFYKLPAGLDDSELDVWADEVVDSILDKIQVGSEPERSRVPEHQRREVEHE